MDRRIRALVVDDELVARASLKLMLEKDPDVEVVGEAYGEATVGAVLSLRPDLMFLDVAMPGMDGFDILSRIPSEALPLVIFVTAFDEHATRAFDERALDYLLKPFSDSRFASSLDRAKRALEDRRALAEHRQLVEQMASQWLGKPIVVTDGSRQLVFRPREIFYVKASGAYVEIVTRRGVTLVRESLNALETQLGSRFVRVHRSALVNFDHVAELRTIAHGDGELVLRGGTVIPVSRARRSAAERALRNE